MAKELKRKYAESPVESPAYLTPNAKRLRDAVGDNVTTAMAKKFLQTQDVYTLNRHVSRKFKRNHYMVNYINDLWQMDLADVSAHAKENEGYKYLLTIIDVLTKYAFVKPLRNKNALTVVKALREVLDSGRGQPKVISSDKGKEFKNTHMTSLLKTRGIEQQFVLTSSPFKASIIEIFNKTLKSRIFRHFTHKGSNYRKYIDKLEEIVTAYNNTVHSVTKMKPIDIEPQHIPYVYHNTHKRHRRRRQAEIKSRIQHLQPGDYVRVVSKQNTFQKTFSEKWTREVFIVAAVINKIPYKLYKLRDMGGTELNGKFYDSELQRVLLPPNRVIRIIKTNGEIGRKQRRLALLANGEHKWLTN